MIYKAYVDSKTAGKLQIIFKTVEANPPHFQTIRSEILALTHAFAN